MAEKVRQYVAIDAKSFYASVECVERHLNPLDEPIWSLPTRAGRKRPSAWPYRLP